MSEMTRRNFLERSGKGAISVAMGGAALSALSARRVLGANERVQLGLIGCGGRGSMVVRNMIEECEIDVTYLCDLREDRCENAANAYAEAAGGHKPKITKEMSELLASKEVDAVIIGTPDHWHAPASILACQAGKDVYVEKPHAHNIWESRKMIEAARKYDRVLQVGTQNRSAPYNLAALEYVKSGELGPIHLVKVYNLKSGGPFQLGDPGKKPDGFDWDAWLGPAPERAYHDHIFNGGWHRFWDFSGGDMVDDGIHQIDLALMLMGDPGLPKAVSTSGGKLAFPDDDSETPDVEIVTYDYDKFIMTFEMTGYPRYMEKTSATIRRNDLLPYWTQNSTRIELYGATFHMTVGRHGGGWIVVTSAGKEVQKMYGRVPDTPHQQNFIECVKTRKRSNADIEKAHAACVLAHMGNIAHLVGNRKLEFDGEKERFKGSRDANKLLKREYRKKYEVPEKV